MSIKQFCPPVLPVLAKTTSINNNSLVDVTISNDNVTLVDSIAYAYMINAMIQQSADIAWVPSRRWMSYWSIISKNGLYEHLAIHGICADNLWPETGIFPTQAAAADAVNHKFSLRRILGGRIAAIEASIDNKQPIIVHIGRYRSFDKKHHHNALQLPTPIKYNDTNDLQDPFIEESSYTVVTYDRVRQLITVISADGFFNIPYYYIEHTVLCTGITIVS
jgi:hypothetical protein